MGKQEDKHDEPRPSEAVDAPAWLEPFSEPVRRWFREAFHGPTDIQRRAWKAIAQGSNALVIAPTGSGKTLAAFLFAIDRLLRQKGAARDAGEPWKPGVRVLYVSPLKALGADVERNLQRPLQAIAALAAEGREGDAAAGEPPLIRTAMRTGDTTPEERRQIARKPPDILITTPESLYLMLTSQAREALRTVQTVIVDEVHALAPNKRGAHLALSLERLDALLGTPAQRVGLSATVRPPQTVARFLGGVHQVEVIQDEGRPAMDVSVVVPVADMTAIPAYGGSGGASGVPKGPRRAAVEEAWKSDRALRALMGQGAQPPATPDTRLGSSSIWPYIENAVLDQVLDHRSTIVFVNSRGLCEKLTARLNELYARRRGAFLPAQEDEGGSYRSDMGSSSALVRDTGEIIAKAHHGSVSKEKRRQVEAELKRGELPCVVATSSLELGIDMGDVDLVLQVAPPPSVASGLQRVGRANHQVGARSRGILYPRTRPEVIDAAVVAEGMGQGAIEPTRLVLSPLDVLAQQAVAIVAMDAMESSRLYELVRRAANFAELPRSAFDATLEMLAGRMNSGELAEFTPRLLWDRSTDMLSPRPGSQRLAVTAAGTIPDRGMFSVVLPEGDASGPGRRRVGELDEEMVMESRVGDVITLGTSTWRITEITGDRVMVQAAPGRQARLPFWHGEALGRPPELGRARGALVRQVAAALAEAMEDDGAAGDVGAATPRRTAAALGKAMAGRLEAAGLDANAQANLASLVALQREATGAVPTDRTLVMEQCEDELGDRRIILHSPYGRAVHQPWALAVACRLKGDFGIDAQVMAADDGIVVQLPMTEQHLDAHALFSFDPEQLRSLVQAEVGRTALFASRFRECAARALLMSPPKPGRRAPLWQQRMKAGQLLEAARREKGFPILAEAARECLQDVFAMDDLAGLMEALQRGDVRLHEAQTTVPSPFAAPLVFGYVGEHLYEGDLPHAEQRASLLSVDPALLGELLGTPDVLALLDPRALEATEAQLQHTAPGWRARSAEELWDLLRELGPLDAREAAERCEPPGDAEPWLAQLEGAHRAFQLMLAGRRAWAADDDARRLHGALGVELPPWARSSADARDGASQGTGSAALDGLTARYARTHGPFTMEALAAALGTGPALVSDALGRLEGEGRVLRLQGADGQHWVDPGVLARLRSRSRALALDEARPVDATAYGRFLLGRQQVQDALPDDEPYIPIEQLAEAIALFEGVYLPMPLWESTVFPARVRGYRPALLDELLAQGEVLWVARPAAERQPGATEAPAGSGALELAFFPADSPLAPTPVSLAVAPWDPAVPEPGEQDPGSAPTLRARILRLLAMDGPLTLPQLAQGLGTGAPDAPPVGIGEVAAQLASLAAEGAVASDGAAFLRAGGQVAQGAAPTPAKAAPRARSRRSSSLYSQAKRQARQQAAARVRERTAQQASLEGRWHALAPNQAPPTLQLLAAVESLLDRYGVVTRAVALQDGIPGGFQALYPVLRGMEESGDVLRGLFVEGMGPVQFASRETVEELRSLAPSDDPQLAVLAADDPANPYGWLFPWPEMPCGSEAPRKAQAPSRRQGSLVVLADGAPVLFASPHLRHLTAFTDDGSLLEAALGALARYGQGRAKQAGGQALREKLAVETVNGVAALAWDHDALLEQAGFIRQPNGYRLYIDPF